MGVCTNPFSHGLYERRSAWSKRDAELTRAITTIASITLTAPFSATESVPKNVSDAILEKIVEFLDRNVEDI